MNQLLTGLRINGLGFFGICGGGTPSWIGGLGGGLLGFVIILTYIYFLSFKRRSYLPFLR